MLSLNTLAIIVAPTAQRLFCSMSGLNDYQKAADHLSHFRVRLAVVSILQGLTRLTYSIVFGSLMLKPLAGRLSWWSLPPPSQIDVFEHNSNPSYLTRVLFHQTYKSGSEAAAIADFCLKYFQDYPVNFYDLAQDCIQPLADTSLKPFYHWIVEDSLSAAYRLGQSADLLPLDDLSALKNCTETNKRVGNVFRASTTIQYQKSYSLRPPLSCSAKRALYLQKVLSASDSQKAINMAKQACQTWLQDHCLQDIEVIRRELSKTLV